MTSAVCRGVEDITGSQPQEPQKEPPKGRKLKKKDPIPIPPAPAPAPAADSDTGDDLSDEEDATGKRKKLSITQNAG